MEPLTDKNTFSKSERLCQKKAIELLFEKGKSFSIAPLKVIYGYAAAKEESPIRILIAVPKKFIRKAHERNRIKRFIRESYRQNKHELTGILRDLELNLHIAFIFTSREDTEYWQVNHVIVEALQRLAVKLRGKHYSKTTTGKQSGTGINQADPVNSPDTNNSLPLNKK